MKDCMLENSHRLKGVPISIGDPITAMSIGGTPKQRLEWGLINKNLFLSLGLDDPDRAERKRRRRRTQNVTLATFRIALQRLLVQRQLAARQYSRGRKISKGLAVDHSRATGWHLRFIIAIFKDANCMCDFKDANCICNFIATYNLANKSCCQSQSSWCSWQYTRDRLTLAICNCDFLQMQFIFAILLIHTILLMCVVVRCNLVCAVDNSSTTDWHLWFIIAIVSTDAIYN